MIKQRKPWNGKERQQEGSGVSNGTVQVLNNLIVAINTQSTRHDKEFKKISQNLEENTKLVRKCMLNLVKFNAERVDLDRRIAELNEASKATTIGLSDLKSGYAKLHERWGALKFFLGVAFTVGGLAIAGAKLL